MTTWNLASADHALSLSLQVTGSESEVLTGTLTFQGSGYGVSGGWAASGSVIGRNFSAFALWGSSSSGDAPNLISATGTMTGSGSAPTQIDIQVDIASSSNGTLDHYRGVLVPV
jgi:hypothetical protein